MNVRRYATALAALAVLGSAPAAVAADASPSASGSASPSPALPSGLFGTSDPTYDGVWRQSLALIAEHAEGIRPATAAVDWLAGQQCANGAFAAYRADVSKACDAKTTTDTNSTAAAVQALAAVGGHDDVTAKAVGWLTSVQNDDGGWGYSAGGPSDANSTSVVIGALAAVHKDPASVTKAGKSGKAGKSPYDALLKLALPCGGKDGGAFAYQPDKKGALAANADATAAAVTASLGAGLEGKRVPEKSSAPACAGAKEPKQAAENGAAYLLADLTKNGDHLLSAMPGAKAQPDYGNTADAVVALATAGHVEQATKAGNWLREHSAAWAKQSGPAAYAQLILAARALGTDPHQFGSADLVAELTATGPAPQATATTTDGTGSKGAQDSAEARTGSTASTTVRWVIGVVVVLVVVIGVLVARKRKQQP